MGSMVTVAANFARRAHDGQTRKYTGEDYFVHPEEVAAILMGYGLPEEVVAAGYLHDVLEDTPHTWHDLAEVFGDEVANLVLEVTDVSRPEDGNRATRKALDREHLSRASYGGASVKLADMISNAQDIAMNDPNFAKMYLREMEALLKVLPEGHPGLRRRAEALILG